MSNKWYVLTGGPGSGKSTLITELQKRGHNTVKESARNYTNKQSKHGISAQTIRKNEKAFQEAVFKEKEIIHDALSEEVLTFFDRGYHDTVAYLEHFGHEVADFIEEVCGEFKYAKVFLLDMLPYENDEARIEDEETAHGIHAALKQAYEESGHEVIEVPVMPVKERADFVLQHLGEDDTLNA